MTLEALIERYNEMLTNFVRTEDAIKEHGLEYVRALGILSPGDDNIHDNHALAILAAFQTALVNVLNDLEGVLKTQKESV